MVEPAGRWILVVGSANMDLVVPTPRLPAAGETVLGGDVGWFVGGKGCNQAVAAQRLGSSEGEGCVLIASFGHDDFKDRILSHITNDGVKSWPLIAETAPTGCAIVSVEEGSGENTIIVSPGANGAMSPDQVLEAITAAIADFNSEPAVVLMQLEVSLRVNSAVAAYFRSRGFATKIILNPAPMDALLPDRSLLRAVDILIPNERELSMLREVEGLSNSTEGDIGAMVRAFEERYNLDIVVTLGERGSFVRGQLVPPYQASAIDTVGAGDCFCAAIAVKISEGCES